MALESFVRQFVVGGVEIHIMIANDVVPGQSEQGDCLVVWFKHAQVVKHHIAQRYAQRRTVPLFSYDLIDNVTGM